MTREEKINTLKAIIQECEEYQWQRRETLFEIIKDLEQEPRKDKIILNHKEYNQLIANEYETGYHKGYDKGYCKGYIVASEEQEPVTIPYLMHKEMDIPISECQKAYDVAMEYLRSHVKVKC